MQQDSLWDANQIVLGNSELALRPEKNFLLFSVFPVFSRFTLRMLRSQTVLIEGKTNRCIYVREKNCVIKLLLCIMIPSYRNISLLQKMDYYSYALLNANMSFTTKDTGMLKNGESSKRRMTF